MDIAEDRDTRRDRAYAVEQCACPTGYKGLSCEVRGQVGILTIHKTMY